MPEHETPVIDVSEDVSPKAAENKQPKDTEAETKAAATGSGKASMQAETTDAKTNKEHDLNLPPDYDPWLDGDEFTDAPTTLVDKGDASEPARSESESVRDAERVFSPTFGFNRIANVRRGYLMFNVNDELVGRSFDQLGEYGEGGLQVLEKILHQGQLVVDIGAHIGGMAIPMGDMVGPQGRIVAYEPQRVLFQTLCGNSVLNSMEHVDTYQIALSDVEGSIFSPEIDFRQPANYGAIEVGRFDSGVPVPKRTFDSHFFYPQLHFMKISAPGMEAKVIQGAKEAIKKFQPMMYVDCERPSHAPMTISALMELGYRLWWHVFPVYTANNFYKCEDNPFPNIVMIHLIAAHKDSGMNIQDLTEVTSPDQFPVFQS